MVHTRKAMKFIREEVPYQILVRIAKNSRITIRELSREIGVSHFTISKVLKELEARYHIYYTVELDEVALGFSEGRLITVKFENTPTREFLYNKFRRDVFVQDAYLGTGDFDLLLYVVGLTSKDFQTWQFKLRMDLSDYVPIFKTSTINEYIVGFLPLKNELIELSPILNKTEKAVLKAVNENSRIKLKELVNKAKTTQMRAIYILEKLEQKKIIRKFAALTQETDKKIILAYGATLTPVKNHQELALNLAKEFTTESFNGATSDYVLDVNINGTYDVFSMCTFKNGEEMSKRGAELVQTMWKTEKPKIDRAILTDIIVGKWPSHLEEYEKQREFIKSVVKQR